MRKSWFISVNDNLGDLNTCPPESPSRAETVRQGFAGQSLSAGDYPRTLSTLIEKTLDAIASQINVHSSLVRIKNLMHFDIPAALRPRLFKQLNLLLGALCYYRQNDRESYDLSHAIMTLLNGQIDSRPQNDDELAETEWQEMQKAVYLLTDWEPQTFTSSPSYATMTLSPR